MIEYWCVPRVQPVALPVWATTQQPVAVQFRKIKLQERLIQQVTIHRDSFLHVIDIYWSLGFCTTSILILKSIIQSILAPSSVIEPALPGGEWRGQRQRDSLILHAFGYAWRVRCKGWVSAWENGIKWCDMVWECVIFKASDAAEIEMLHSSWIQRGT